LTVKATTSFGTLLATWTVLACTSLLAGEAYPATVPAETGRLVLDEGSNWRMFATWNRPVVRQGADLKECMEPKFAERTEPPPAEWVQTVRVKGKTTWDGNEPEESPCVR
jgi:hypothetical protein